MKHETKLHGWWAAFVVGAAAVTGLAMAPPAGAVEDVTVVRLAGADRFETAADIATAAHPTGAASVVVANGLSFPDALAGAALAGDVDAPLLLTEPDAVPAATSAAITELGADTVYLLGGTASASPGVETALGANGREVVRIAGDDRYLTAAEIGQEIGAAGVAELGGLKTAIVATGLDFADALAGGPVAAAGDGSGVHPILLVNSTVPEATAAAIDELAVEQVVVLGGTSAVSALVELQLEALTGNPAIRIAGADRFATGAAIARAAVDSFGFDLAEVLLANGSSFADALAGGPLGAVRSAPVLLTPPGALATPTRDLLQAESDVVETITVLGGTAAISDATAQAAEAAAEADPGRAANETIDVLTRAAEEVANGSTREFTATGLGTGPVDVVLVECADVSTVGDETRFANANANANVDGGAQAGSAPDTAAVEDVRISEVNGTARQTFDPTIVNDDYANDVTPADGTVTFVVEGPADDSTASVCVVPVVFVDANTDEALNGSTADPSGPSEAFGTGGRTTFSPTGATAGQFAAHGVTATDKAGDRFTGCVPGATPISPEVCRTFRYDAGDTFQLNSQAITLDQFEGQLSAGDSVRGTYAPEPAGVSTFNLTDVAPLPPTELAATVSGTNVRLTFTDSETPTVDRYRLYRAPRSGATCPDFNTAVGRASYAAVTPAVSTIEGQPAQGETADTGNGGTFTPAPTYVLADRTAAPSTTYCYVVVSVDRESASDPTGDEGAGTAAVAVTTSAAQAVITDSRATSANPTLDAGDTIRLAFDRAVTSDATAAGVAVTVRGSNQIGARDETFTCGATGGRATCAYDAATQVLTVTITAATTQQYPLTLVSVTVPSGPVVDLASSDRSVAPA